MMLLEEQARGVYGAGGPIGPAVAGGFAREGARVSSVPRSSLQVPLPSRPLVQPVLGWRAAATRWRSGGDDTFDGREACM
jgi:hypothetical protein